MTASPNYGTFGKLILAISSVPAGADLHSSIADNLRAYSGAAFVATSTYDRENRQLAERTFKGGYRNHIVKGITDYDC